MVDGPARLTGAPATGKDVRPPFALLYFVAEA